MIAEILYLYRLQLSKRHARAESSHPLGRARWNYDDCPSIWESRQFGCRRASGRTWTMELNNSGDAGGPFVRDWRIRRITPTKLVNPDGVQIVRRRTVITIGSMGESKSCRYPEEDQPISASEVGETACGRISITVKTLPKSTTGIDSSLFETEDEWPTRDNVPLKSSSVADPSWISVPDATVVSGQMEKLPPTVHPVSEMEKPPRISLKPTFKMILGNESKILHLADAPKQSRQQQDSMTCDYVRYHEWLKTLERAEEDLAQPQSKAAAAESVAESPRPPPKSILKQQARNGDLNSSESAVSDCYVDRNPISVRNHRYNPEENVADHRKDEESLRKCSLTPTRNHLSISPKIEDYTKSGRPSDAKGNRTFLSGCNGCNILIFFQMRPWTTWTSSTETRSIR